MHCTMQLQLIPNVYCRYGLPTAVKFDNALYFRAQLTADLLHLLGVQRIYSPPYNPKVRE